MLRDEGLEAEEGSFEEGAGADACNNLEANDGREGGGCGEESVEAVADCHERDAEVDNLKVAACAMN